MNDRGQRTGGNRRGGALLISLVAVMVLAGMTAAMMTMSTAAQRENRAASDRVQALYLAEAGLSRAIADLNSGAPQQVFGTSTAPVDLGKGGFWGTSADNGNGTFTIRAFGTSAGKSRGVEAILVESVSSIFSNALFAGNSSGDPTYSLDFGGCADQADDIRGPVYSGNDVGISCDANIAGAIRAQGTITGGIGIEGSAQPLPDIAGMQYQINNNFDVASAFAAATWEISSSMGGSAFQLPEDNPCHIFRKNPDDRAGNINGTPKDDYFLEDPFESKNSSSVIDPSAGAQITLSGLGGEPGPDGNGAVYYIDGNLWVHNKNMFSFTLANGGADGVKMTIVVRGNIYISDNIFYEDPDNSGLALIAINDANEPDSGNIFFGDPTWGTLEYMDAFMFAENDFYDNNLDGTGSKTVTVNGNMTAGNQVNINRDFNGQHSKLTVDFDPRISDASLNLPGLPSNTQGVKAWKMASWREVPVP